MIKRNTPQKKAVCECLAEMGHPTASALYLRVRQQCPEISRATVFRILKEKAESGEALRLSVGDGEDRYDLTTRVHYHIRCLSCGRVEDAALAPLAALAEFSDAENGFQITGHSASFFGVCPDCAARGR
jgi:Fe2+ or Zn2+ uptake regulation protein